MSDTPVEYDFDVAMIGAGSGGFAAARTAVGAGLKPVVLEGGAEVGGLCILRGCMPSKALLYAAEVRHLIQRAGIWGIHPGRADFDFSEVMARKQAMIRDFADHRRKQLEQGKFTFRRATARFTDSHTLALSDGSKLTARHFVISTGSVVAPAPLPELDEVGYLTSDDVFTLTRLPKSLIVLGGGAIAVELAQFLARFDVKITLIQRSGQLLRDFDADAAGEVEKALTEEGITIHTQTRLVSAERVGDMKQVTFESDGRMVKVGAEEILFALGRIPNTAGLNLAAAGVATEKTRIVTADTMQTSVPHIYAVGDCTGPHEIVHIAIQQGEIAAHNIARPETPRHTDYRLLTSVVFTEPQLAVVGLTEKEAQVQNIPYLTASYPFNDHGKSLIMEALHGFVKLLADPQTGEIIGGCCVGPLGGELIHEINVAMAKRMTVHEFAVVPHYHPTLAEIWTYPAEELAEKIPLS
ncbi:MAG TPA: NAD(P)/FAD-dependent oxidoreductase [Dongiaceae bacterium]|nr:NAD(P)/FAD-dependent oxidoreductase [Dongiaceae bacterium]